MTCMIIFYIAMCPESLNTMLFKHWTVSLKNKYLEKNVVTLPYFGRVHFRCINYYSFKCKRASCLSSKSDKCCPYSVYVFKRNKNVSIHCFQIYVSLVINVSINTVKEHMSDACRFVE